MRGVRARSMGEGGAAAAAAGAASRAGICGPAR